MEATYSISEDDYVAAARLSARQWTALETIFAWIYGGFVLSLSAVTLQGKSPNIIHLVGVIVGGAVCVIILIAIIRKFDIPWNARRIYRPFKLIHDPLKIRLKEFGVELESEDCWTRAKWEKIHKWRQNDSYLLIFMSPNVYLVIPKRIADQGFDMPTLIKMLQKHVGKAA